MDYIFVLLAFFFLTLPGILLGPALLRRTLGVFGSLIVGCGLGIVILLDADALLSAFTRIDAMKLGAAIGIAAAIALFVFFLNIGIPQLRRKWPWGIMMIMTAGVAVRVLPLLRSQYPLGWDTTFHLLIAKAALMTGKIPKTWEPFEHFALNYPWGSQVMMANIAQVTGVPLHTVFSVCVTMIFSALSIGIIYVIAGSLGFEKNARLGSAFAYAFLANSGSLDYFRWGGLPNQIGMFLFLAALAVFTSDLPSRAWRLGLSGFLLSGVVLVHHHSMVTAFGIILFIAAIACLARLRSCAIGLDAVIVVTIGLAASFFQSWKLFARIGQADQVGVLRFKETLNIFETPFVDGGILLMIFAVLGFYMVYKDREDNVLFLHGWTLALFAAFTVGYYVWKIYSRLAWGESFVAMTPSRFLTDMAYPLSLYGGLFLGRLFIGHKGRQRMYKNLLLSLLAMISIYYVMFQMNPTVKDADAEAMNWLRDNTPADALIVNEGPAQFWVPYLSEREVTTTAIPISEREDQYKSSKLILADCVTGKKDRNDCREVLSGFARRDIYIYTPVTMSGSRLTEVFENGAAHIYYVKL